MERGRYALYATRVEDRFGNWVSYSYSNAASAPVKLTRIESSDGRVITLAYTGSRLSSVTAQGRTWNYGYNSAGALASVTLPDASAWTINLPDFQNLLIGYIQYSPQEPWRSCTDPGEIMDRSYVGSITHPAGATGSFTVFPSRFVKDGLDESTNCYVNDPSTTNDDQPIYPMAWDSYAVESKTIGGPGLANATWKYTYSGGRATEVSGPDGYARYTYGNVFRQNEGKLLKVERGESATQILDVQDLSYELAPSGQNFPIPVGQSGHPKTPDWGEANLRPQKQAVFTRQGVTFSQAVQSFDAFARPLGVLRSSTTMGSPSRTEANEYFDNIALWVLGQRKKLTVNGLVAEEVGFDDSYAVPLTRRSFGKLEQTLSYDTLASVDSGQRGTVKTLQDGANKVTKALNWKRGMPQNIIYADGTSDSAVVDDRGWITSYRDENGYQTCFAYDVLGRVQQTTYPTEASPFNCGTANWTAKTSKFQQVAVSEFGIAAGHWKSTVNTGNAVKETYFDAMWRPLLTREYDAANQDATRRMVLRYFDSKGRKVFESYPQNSIAGVTATPYGTTTKYDALGRITQTLADSELNWLKTSYAYQNGFQTAVTNPRGYTTTTSYRAFDNPEETQAVAIAAPQGVNVAISRDVFDKPLKITRSGGDASISRTYVYDAYERLCKTIEPESGATLVDYDDANNIIWRAVGTTLTSKACDRASAAAARKISTAYDLRNRPTIITYADGSQRISNSYTPDGQLLQTVANHGTNPITWNYAYNARRQLVREGYSWWPDVAVNTWSGWNFDYSIDALGNVSALTDRWGTMNYAPNALGQPTRVANYATNVVYHPSGAVASYTLNNGITHATTLNTRGLPLRVSYAGVAQDAYTYDANGNITAITDEQQGTNNRNMPSYDGLDRLTEANGPWGNAKYGYDALDNLVSSVVGTRTLGHTIDYATNRLTGLSGSQSIGIAYDANGNISQRGSQVFGFDIGNRMRSASGKIESIVYDGHGRRSLQWFADGRYLQQAYTKDGKLRAAYRSNEGYTRHVYLGDKLIAEYADNVGADVFSHTDMLGSPMARTNASGALISRTRYEPYGATVAGSTNPTKIGFTGHVNDVETGLVYMQQRYYDPIAGRFLSVDPVTTDAKTGSSFNRYVYGNNNPYRFKDPDGRFAIPLIPLIIEAVVAAVGSNAGAAAVGIAGGVAIGAAINQSQNSSGSAAPGPSSGQQVSAPPPGTQSSSQGCIYCVKGENTSSGRDYVGSTDNMGQRAKDTSDGRNREGAPVVGTYDKGDKQGRRNAEQQAINDRGGVDKLDNKRNEVAPKSWGDQGIKPPETSK